MNRFVSAIRPGARWSINRTILILNLQNSPGEKGGGQFTARCRHDERNSPKLRDVIIMNMKFDIGVNINIARIYVQDSAQVIHHETYKCNACRIRLKCAAG